MSLKNVFSRGEKVESFGCCSLFLALFYGKETKLSEKWIQMIQNWQGVENGVLFKVKELLAISLAYISISTKPPV